MGRPPAYIFIVRHGNRLDAADKLWHLSSPTPYDPPLTYGGWTQSRAIGQRIGDILREINTTETRPTTASSTGHARPPKKRRYKVVIHSSPFLRCIQTSISVAAGLAYDARPLQTPIFAPGQSPPIPGHPHGQQHPAVDTPINVHKSLLRLDAFLGEWLSPGYFELITPPPSSYLMLSTAKSELLRREDYSSFMHTVAHTHSNSTSQLWGSGGARTDTWTPPRLGKEEETPAVPASPNTPSSASRPKSPPGLFGSAGSSPVLGPSGDYLHPGHRWRSSSERVVLGPNPGSNGGGYVAPVPHFALSQKAPAPACYVAHARDNCVEVDYQWDSMRPPLDWGDGGEFGEEWTSMHRRFRRGLQHLVDWYTTSDCPAEPVTKAVRFKAPSESGKSSSDCAIEDDDSCAEDGDDYIEESVVILVSHGAGCNALIGAITQHPVLMDVGLSSLTVAARKPGMEKMPVKTGPSNGAESDRRSHAGSTGSDLVHHPDGIVPLNQFYDMKLFASTEHLRPSSSSSRASSIAGVLSGSNGAGSGMSVAGGARGRHANALSSALASAGISELGAGRSVSAGSVGLYNIDARRPSGTATRPSWLLPAITTNLRDGANGNGNANTNGNGNAASSGATLASPLGRSSQTSIGLWSPISIRGDDDDDDMEIRLSFGPDSTPKTPKPLRTLSEKKKAKETREMRFEETEATSSTPDTATAFPSFMSPTTPITSGGLWSAQSRLTVEPEPVHDMTTKRRWTVNERA